MTSVATCCCCNASAVADDSCTGSPVAGLAAAPLIVGIEGLPCAADGWDASCNKCRRCCTSSCRLAFSASSSATLPVSLGMQKQQAFRDIMLQPLRHDVHTGWLCQHYAIASCVVTAAVAQVLPVRAEGVLGLQLYDSNLVAHVCVEKHTLRYSSREMQGSFAQHSRQPRVQMDA